MDYFVEKLGKAFVVFVFILCFSAFAQDDLLSQKTNTLKDCAAIFERVAISPYADSTPKDVHTAFLKYCCEGNESRFEEIVKHLKNSLESQYGLTDDERVAIASYIGAKAYPMNEALRKRSSELLQFELIIRLANSGLSKLPDYNGTVYRVTSGLPNDEISKYVLNSTVTFDGFTSTNRDSSWLKLWGNQAQVRYVIHSKHGKDVSLFNGKENEREVLFRSGTKFKVLSRNAAPNGSLDIILEETP